MRGGSQHCIRLYGDIANGNQYDDMNLKGYKLCLPNNWLCLKHFTISFFFFLVLFFAW